LLNGYSAETAIEVFATPPLKTDNRREYAPALDLISTLPEARELAPKQYPLLVTFGDINDPASVKRVDPNNLELAFGPGYALQSITLSITDEPVTKGEVQKVLGWLGDGNTFKQIWSELSPQQHDLLSSVNWRKE
jgi:hypothetical protein